jgi:hypothetical protein
LSSDHCMKFPIPPVIHPSNPLPPQAAALSSHFHRNRSFGTNNNLRIFFHERTRTGLSVANLELLFFFLPYREKRYAKRKKGGSWGKCGRTLVVRNCSGINCIILYRSGKLSKINRSHCNTPIGIEFGHLPGLRLIAVSIRYQSR